MEHEWVSEAAGVANLVVQLLGLLLWIGAAVYTYVSGKPAAQVAATALLQGFQHHGALG
jgi:hypothetical protein